LFFFDFVFFFFFFIFFFYFFFFFFFSNTQIDEHRVLVEPACGASLAVAYEKQIKELLQKLNIEVNSSSKIVIIVCGGQLVNQELFENWKNSKL